MSVARDAARKFRDLLPPTLRNGLTETWINVRNGRFRGSDDYWKQRYASGSDSGSGSGGRLAQAKADFVNAFVREHDIASVIEFGSGDGRQASLFDVPRFVGLDISPDAVRISADLNAEDTRKSFILYSGGAFFDRAGVLRSELALSLDVLYHLTEFETCEQYVRDLFASATRYVIVYTTDPGDGLPSPNHVVHWSIETLASQLAEEWTLVQSVENSFPFQWSDPDNSSDARFYVFEAPTR